MISLVRATLVLFFLVHVVIGPAHAQNASSCAEAMEVIDLIQEHHFSPRKIDDLYSKLVYDEFLTQLDPLGYLLTKEDILVLSAHEHELDDQIVNSDCLFLSEVAKIYKERIDGFKAFVNETKHDQLEFHELRKLTLSNKPQYRNVIDQKDDWTDLVKLRVLHAYFSETEINQRAESDFKDSVEAIAQVRKVRSFNGDEILKPALLECFKLTKTILKEDYDEILDMEEIAEKSFDAMAVGDVSAMEQSSNALVSFVDKGLEKLKSTKTYMGDMGVVTASKRILNFYKKEATTQFPKMMDFLLLSEDFAKSEKQFEAIRKNKRTQSDVDKINKLGKKYNLGVNNHNQLIDRYNKQRHIEFDAWNKAVSSFFDRHN